MMVSAADSGRPPAYDEMVTGDGAIRPHWQSVVGALTALPPLVFAERAERARQQFAENGVTYNVYNDPRGAGRSWSVDLLPLPIAAAEWAELSAALAQRARLIDRVLADLYGPQDLIAERLLPPSLVFDNPRFLRPCIGTYGGRHRLHVYAADLVRAGGDRWWVLADRIDAPSGAGYALENRNVLARVLPEAFRSSHVRRLRPFFEIWQAVLHQAAPQGRDPRVVLLTPGPYNETYFEHVYLARELGLTLVEGGDLTVRDSRVFLKTLDGLQPVDAILRRQDGEWCDPLELRSESNLGVPGLVEAVRAGNVTVLNPLGSGVAETPALAAFLPILCRRLLGEELAIPSVATWWCGQQAALDQVTAEVERMVVLPAFADARTQPVYADALSRAARAALLARIKAAPQRWCAQERVSGSAMPIWTAAGMKPQPLVLRCYLVRSGDDFIVMPGGLTRVSPQLDRPLVSMQQGGVAKDTWVIAADGYEIAVPSAAPPAIAIRRTPDDLPSRAAENLFWLGRYAERLDASVRILRAPLVRLAAGGLGPRDRLEVAMACKLAASYGLLDAEVAAWPPESGAFASALVKGCTEGPAPEQLVRTVQGLANRTRDRLSTDLWQLTATRLSEALVQLRNAGGAFDRLLRALDRFVDLLAAFAGLAAENITRHAGWRFLDLGRRVERGMFAIAIGRAALAQGADTPALKIALELADSAITYRLRYMSAPTAATVLDLVLTDGTNPRALAFQRQRIADLLGQLPERSGIAPLEFMGIRPHLDAMARDGVSQAALARLDLMLGEQHDRLARLSDGLSVAYFSHVGEAHALGYDLAAE